MANVTSVLSGMLLSGLLLTGPVSATDTPLSARWQQQANDVTITRDDWGIPHIHGKTDADAVFGMIYAQAEDDFRRVEDNYLDALGRRAEAEGESAIWQDLRMKLFVDPAVMKDKYAHSPTWLKNLMNAWADGLNYYLATHPEVHPRVITRFEPWMALAFSEGSIGGDITRVSLKDLAAFYADDQPDLARTAPPSWAEPTGSNGIAIAPRLTHDGHALLLINPHVTFYFRTESQISSDDGLDAYGASTWGQFFIYQGFNKHLGWMHTSTGADAVDEFAETIKHKDGQPFYQYGDKLLPVKTRTIKVPYKNADGHMASRTFTAYYTQHGPVVRTGSDGKWITTALMQRPMRALEQSWLRTKAHDLASYRQVSKLQANSSNNTLYADDQGNIAFLMPQFIPKRDDRFDYTKPVDGADPATAWQGPTPLDELPNVINPPNGWVMNTNNWPWSAAGKYSPKRKDFPHYMDTFGENPRGVHATRMLSDAGGFSMPKLISDAFDSYLPAFARLIPVLVDDYDHLDADDPLHAKLAGPINLLRNWDDRWGTTSMPTSLAVFWGDELWNTIYRTARAQGTSPYDYMADKAGADTRLQALARATDRLTKDFGHWGVAWGAINRYQRLDDRAEPHFDDNKPSLPVPFVSSRWGSLASFGAHRWKGTRRYYGNSGNSFVATVEFAPEVRARAIRAGGQSGDPASRHFTDQAERYIQGNLRTVYFRAEQLKQHSTKSYHPGR